MGAGAASASSAGWPRSARLTQRAEFVGLQEGGARLSSRCLVFRFRATQRGESRFGLTVSRKVGNAVVRNRVKRWLRESLRRRRVGLAPVDVVIIARGDAANAGFDALDAEVGWALRTLSKRLASS